MFCSRKGEGNCVKQFKDLWAVEKKKFIFFYLVSEYNTG